VVNSLSLRASLKNVHERKEEWQLNLDKYNTIATTAVYHSMSTPKYRLLLHSVIMHVIDASSILERFATYSDYSFLTGTTRIFLFWNPVAN